MENHLNIDQTVAFVPKVELKKNLKKVIVSGRCRMPDPGTYFQDFSNMLTSYFHEFNRTLFIEFYFDYINTGSSKWILFVLQQLNTEYKKNGGMIEIVWKYDEDDETIQETGEVLSAHLDIPIILKAV